jgi:hypothetical protein
MTCMRPKTYFLRPDVALPLGIALLRELWAQKVWGGVGEQAGVSRLSLRIERSGVGEEGLNLLPVDLRT